MYFLGGRGERRGKTWVRLIQRIGYERDNNEWQGGR